MSGRPAPAPSTAGVFGAERLAVPLLAMGIGAVLGRGLTFVTVAYTARVIGRSAFGLLGFGTSVAAYAAILVGPGFLVWGARAIARDRSYAADYLAIINPIQLALAAISYLILVAIAAISFTPAQRGITIAAGVSLFAVALSVEWVAQGLERFRLIAAGQVTAAAAALVLTIVFVHGSADVYRVPLVLALGQICGIALVATLLVRGGLLKWPAIEPRQAYAVLRSSLPLGISVAMVTVLHYANNIYLEFFRGSAELGTFVAAYRVLEVLAFVPGVITTVLLPRLARLYSVDAEAWRRTMRAYVALAMTAGMLPAVALALEAKGLVSAVYGAQFAASAPVLTWFGFAVVFNFAAIAYINGLLGMGKDRAYLLSIGAALIVSIAVGAVAVARWGLMGATAVVSCLDLVTWTVAVGGYLVAGAPLFLEAWVRPSVAAIAAGLVLVAGANAGATLWIRLTAAVVVYLAVSFPAREVRLLLTRAPR